jgi:hypothetical protein
LHPGSVNVDIVAIRYNPKGTGCAPVHFAQLMTHLELSGCGAGLLITSNVLAGGRRPSDGARIRGTLPAFDQSSTIAL